MFRSPTYRITALHYTYWCPASSAAYNCFVYLHNHWITLELWVAHHQRYTTHMGVQP